MSYNVVLLRIEVKVGRLETEASPIKFTDASRNFMGEAFYARFF